MSRRQEIGQDVDIDITRLFAAVWEKRIAVLSLTLIVCAAAFVIAGSIPPRFQGETRILIEAREPIYTDTLAREAGQSQTLDERGVASQVEIINSPDLIKAVAAELNLAEEPDFVAAARPSFLSTIMARLGLAPDLQDAPPEERLIETFRQHLTVYQIANSRVIVVAFWSTDNRLAATVANTIAETYLEMQSGAKLVTNTDATEWLEPEIAELRDRVRQAEEKVAAYRAESGLVLVDENATLINRQLADISTELARVRAEKADALARAAVVTRAVERGETSGDFSNVFESDVIQRLRDRQADLQSTIADLSVTLLDGHPRIKGLRSQSRDIDNQISAETLKVLRGLENEAELASIREQELSGQLDALKAESAQAGSEEVELRALEREARAQRELLEAYLARYREAASRSDRGNLPADARIIATAIVPGSPYFPKMLPIVVVAALSTLLLSSIVIMLRELFTGRGLMPVEVAAYGDSPAQASEYPLQDAPLRPGASVDAVHVAEPASWHRITVPPATPAEDIADDPRPDSIEEPRVAEASLDDRKPESAEVPVTETGEVQNVEPEVLPLAPEQPDTDGSESPMLEPDTEHSVSAVTGHLIATQANVAIVVSPEGDKGSTTSVMLARMLANEGRQTLLLDMTGSACPSRMMAPRSDLPGITNVLSGDCSIPDAVHADRLSNAHILPRGSADPAKAMAHSSELPNVIEALADVYDTVIVECGPANSEGVKQLLDGRHVVEMIFSIVQPDEHLMAEYLTDFYAEGFESLLMMSPGAGTPSRPDRSAA